jgi:hypothetical protein
MNHMVSHVRTHVRMNHMVSRGRLEPSNAYSGIILLYNFRMRSLSALRNAGTGSSPGRGRLGSAQSADACSALLRHLVHRYHGDRHSCSASRMGKLSEHVSGTYVPGLVTAIRRGGSHVAAPYTCSGNGHRCAKPAAGEDAVVRTSSALYTAICRATVRAKRCMKSEYTGPLSSRRRSSRSRRLKPACEYDDEWTRACIDGSICVFLSFATQADACVCACTC